MKATLGGMYIIGKREQCLIESVIVLNCRFYLNVAAFSFNDDRLVKRGVSPVQILDKFPDAALVKEFFFFFFAFVLDGDLDALVEKSQFPETANKNFI